jgi:hypothetical protein
MLREARQHVTGVLPDGLGHDQRRRRIDAPERFDAAGLAVQEAVLLDGIDRVPANDGAVQSRERPRHGGFQRGLRRPAHAIDSKTRVATCNETDLVCHGSGLFS